MNKALRILLQRKEVEIHGVTVPLDLIPYAHAIKELDRGTYEDAEAALIIGHIAPGNLVIELGASLGVISSVIGRTAPVRLLCVEALPELAAVARRMLARNCPEVPHKVIECAIAPADGTIPFDYLEGDNFTGRAKCSAANKRTVELPAKRLSTILHSEGIGGPFYLVSDIEGMEVALLLDDAGALVCCAGLVIEAHYTEYQGRKFSPDDTFHLCESLGFKLIERRRNVAYLSRAVAQELMQSKPLV